MSRLSRGSSMISRLSSVDPMVGLSVSISGASALITTLWLAPAGFNFASARTTSPLRRLMPSISTLENPADCDRHFVSPDRRPAAS